MVSQQLIAELGVIIKEDYGIELQPHAVAEVANNLVNFFELLAKIEYQTPENNEEEFATQESIWKRTMEAVNK